MQGYIPFNQAFVFECNFLLLTKIILLCWGQRIIFFRYTGLSCCSAAGVNYPGPAAQDNVSYAGPHGPA